MSPEYVLTHGDQGVPFHSTGWSHYSAHRKVICVITCDWFVGRSVFVRAPNPGVGHRNGPFPQTPTLSEMRHAKEADELERGKLMGLSRVIIPRRLVRWVLLGYRRLRLLTGVFRPRFEPNHFVGLLTETHLQMAGRMLISCKAVTPLRGSWPGGLLPVDFD